jgi:Na+-transporting NADH:ubiquinone oxidoreductase subunit C
MVIIVAAALAFASGLLKKPQELNRAIEKKMNILVAANKAADASTADDKNSYIENEYSQYITEQFVVNVKGEKIEGNAFDIDLSSELKKPETERQLPVFVCTDNADQTFIFPVYGPGLWGPIWGYIALGSDFNTVTGAIFDHKSETPGLGAEVATDWFRHKFINKLIYNDTGFVSVKVVKAGSGTTLDDHTVDGISGGTITSKAVSALLFESLSNYKAFIDASQTGKPVVAGKTGRTVTPTLSAKAPETGVDERTELLSAVFRLADVKEYASDHDAPYLREIDSVFAPFKTHRVVRYAADINRRFSINNAAVMSYAVNTEIRDGQIVLTPNTAYGSLDPHWTGAAAEHFLRQLNDFYTQSNFHSFHESHQALYAAARERFIPTLATVDFDWIAQFFGQESDAKYRIILNLLNNANNCETSVTYNTGDKIHYSVTGTAQFDDKGLPVYDNSVCPSIIRQYSRFYATSLIDETYPQLAQQAETLYKPVKWEMRQQLYSTAKSMMTEYMVRATTIKYCMSKGIEQNIVNQLIEQSEAEHFTAIEKLVESLSNYENQRDKYPTLKDYIPEIAKFADNNQ